MKRFSTGLALLAMTLLAAPSAVKAADDAKPKKKAAAKGKGRPVGGYWGIIANSLDLTDAQKPKYMAIVKAQSAKNKAIAEKSKAAKDDKDAQKKLRDEKAKVSADTKSQIMDLLDNGQKNTLSGYTLYMGMMRAVSKAEVSDNQKAKIKSAAFAAGADYRKAGDDKKAMGKVRNDLRDKVVKDILTADQRNKLQSAAKVKPAKPKKPKA